ncbi:MAG: class I SAM-dependent methyltransferase [Armatimonadetes bacterium]|nr:class I SAM-dependent methyltransferase [Armatimonadota bacterium]
MSSTDPGFLRDHQYKDSSNLQARIDLHGRYSTNPQPFWTWAFDFLDVPAEAQILEVGCGTGMFWQVNADRLPPGWRVTLTDLSTGMLGSARANLANVPQVVECQVADVQLLPYPDASFDAVLANFMLYHVPDRRQGIAEIARVLRPGGLLIAATNGSTHLREIRDLERRFGIETLFGATTSAQAFGLQNGAAQLEGLFDHIACERHENHLAVPKPEPVIAHIRSKLADRGRAADRLEVVRAHIAKHIEQYGEFRVTKASGLFVARRKES